MTKDELKQYIDENVYENQDGDITGESLNAVLKAIVDDGGTEVEANPTGEATDRLEKIKIGETIYTAPEGPEGPTGPANTLSIGTVQSGQTAAASITGDAPNQQLNLVLPKGEQGDPGQDAVNPFKGWFTTDNIPTTGQAGDYCNVSDTSVTPHTVTIYRWDNTQNAFVNTNEVPDTATGETFASSETLQQVAIDNSHLVNPVNTADPTKPVLAQAEDVMELKAKLEGVTASAVKATIGEQISGYINGNGEPTSSSSGNTYVVIPLNNAKSVRLLGSTNVSSGTTRASYAFWKSAIYVDSNTVVEAYNWDVSEGSTYAKEYILTVPNGATHIAVTLVAATNKPNFYCYLQSGESVVDLMPKIVDNLEEGGHDKALSAEQGKILNDLLFKDIEINSYSLYSGYIRANGDEQEFGSIYWRYYDGKTTSYYDRMARIPISNDVSKITIKANDSNGTRIAFIVSGGTTKNSSQTQNNTCFLSANTGLILIPQGETRDFEVPTDANYLYIRLGRIDEDLPFTPEAIIFHVNKITEFDNNIQNTVDKELVTFSGRLDKNIAFSNIPLRNVDGWQGATNFQEKMAIKKADRLVNCKWTPITNGICWSTRSINTIEHYVAGTEYKGIPYSSNTDHAKWLGTHVSLYTFLTAVKNKYSMLYTECVKDGYSASAWGYEYHSGNGSTYYGTVCCGFTSYCTNGNVVYNNNQFWQRDDAFIIIQLHNQDAQKFNLDLLRIGDVLNNGGHSFLIYDLYVENGHVTKIKAKQATSGVDTTNHIAKGATYRLDDDGYDPQLRPIVIDGVSGDVNNFDHFRFKNFASNVEFKPFDVNVYDDNGDVDINYNFDICPIAGDKCTFAVGQIVALNFNTNDSNEFPYTHIALLKDNETQNNYVISEIDTSELDPSQRGHAIKLNNLTEGKYTAWCWYSYNNEIVNSATCTFIVVGANDFGYKITDEGIELTLINPEYRITNVGMNEIKNGYYVPNPFDLQYEYDQTIEVAVIQPQKVLIPKSQINNFDLTRNYTLSWIDIMTEFGIQRLKDIPLLD